MIETVTVPCVVCEADVVMLADKAQWPEPPTCIDHYFGDDPTEAWEAE